MVMRIFRSLCLNAPTKTGVMLFFLFAGEKMLHITILDATLLTTLEFLSWVTFVSLTYNTHTAPTCTRIPSKHNCPQQQQTCNTETRVRLRTTPLI